MKKAILWSFPFLFFAACISISVKGYYSDYDKLTDAEKEKVVFLDPDSVLSVLQNNGKVYAVTGKQLKEELVQQDSALVYFWSPHCSSESCVLVEVCQEYADKQNYKLYVVADYYDMEVMDAQNKSHFPMLIPNHKYYETDVRLKYGGMFREGLGFAKEQKGSYFRYLLFAKGKYVKSYSDIFN